MIESTLDLKSFTNSLKSFPVPSSPGSKTRAGRVAAFVMESVDIEHCLTPAKSAALIRDEQQKVVAAARQLSPGHVQPFFRHRNPIGDPLGEVHGDQPDVAHEEGIGTDGCAAGRQELNVYIERRRQGPSQRRRDNPYLRIVRVIVGSGMTSGR